MDSIQSSHSRHSYSRRVDGDTTDGQRPGDRNEPLLGARVADHITGDTPKKGPNNMVISTMTG
ncbi:hypothetical protein [Methanosphaerula palustris]|uniref:hypothetical protein n=1 Tax=Methanosphaerula palustris TaxID=475088 RepID=UPI00032525F2|nr:hypothetical protein [Methanosphaerula palustris]